MIQLTKALAFAVLAGVLLAPNTVAQVNPQPRMDRVSVFVTDLDRSLTFYRDVLGFEMIRTLNHGENSFVSDLVAANSGRSLKEALLEARPSGQTIGLVESGRGGAADRAGGTTFWVEVVAFDHVIGKARALGLDVLEEKSNRNVNAQPVREQTIVDWDGNRVLVYSLDDAETVSGECVSVGNLQRWKVFDDRQIYIEGSVPGSRYLLTMRARCRGALYSRVFEIPNETGRLCRTDARLAYRDAGLRRTCRVDAFELVPDVEEAERRANSRRDASHYQ